MRCNATSSCRERLDFVFRCVFCALCFSAQLCLFARVFIVRFPGKKCQKCDAHSRTTTRTKNGLISPTLSLSFCAFVFSLCRIHLFASGLLFSRYIYIHSRAKRSVFIFIVESLLCAVRCSLEEENGERVRRRTDAKKKTKN